MPGESLAVLTAAEPELHGKPRGEDHADGNALAMGQVLKNPVKSIKGCGEYHIVNDNCPDRHRGRIYAINMPVEIRLRNPQIIISALPENELLRIGVSRWLGHLRHPQSAYSCGRLDRDGVADVPPRLAFGFFR